MLGLLGAHLSRKTRCNACQTLADTQAKVFCDVLSSVAL